MMNNYEQSSLHRQGVMLKEYGELLTNIREEYGVRG
jgi:hypothetical protein